MKLGEALRVRSDNLKKVAELRTRAVAGTQIQEGEAAPDSPEELLAQIERTLTETTQLIQRINRTNVATMLPDRTRLVDALAQRDACLALRAPFQAVADAVSATQSRYMRSEIRIVRTVDPATLRKRVDELSRRHRLLDIAIQEANWSTELAD